MIEFKDVSACQKAGGVELKGYSRVIRNGEMCQLDLATGELIINVILGFCPVSAGYVCFDGMTLNEYSAPFLRKLIAYIPKPTGFEKVIDLGRKQLEMVADAMQSDADIILAVDPFSHLADSQVTEVRDALCRKAEKGRVVVVATDNIYMGETDDESENL